MRAIGGVTVYEPRGEYQLVVRQLEPEGVGPLELAFRQRFARLAAEGLFDPARKRPLPRYPRRIVIVTSPTGAAVRDVLQVTGRRWRCAEILIAPTRVQGDGADREVVAALALANQVAGADIIIVARGGGSLEDLWTFNEEAVARAIAALAPAGRLGHRPRDRRDPRRPRRRPTRPDPQRGRRDLRPRRPRDRARTSTASPTGSAPPARPTLLDARARLDRLAEQSRQALRQLLDDRRHRLTRLAASLDALSPLAVLARGYSLTLDPTDPDLSSAPPIQVQPGQLILTRLAQGQIISRVESTS